ncbi:MAG: malto-oligosyltrehalose synthase [Desulfurivibrio sp.]|nr:MAG: malto-oligosyltrehalose synthase [Desulfurivibrio sp.]
MENNPTRTTPSPRIPSATYRLQFHAGFGFRDASVILPYLRDLGVTDVYASPYLKARAGSTNGYDIVSYDGLSREVGTGEEYEAFTHLLRDLGMGQILDIVPNHMCVEGGENPWWQDLLENGPGSVHARTFDINWDPVKKELKNKVLIPVLGDQYGNVLENGELILVFDNGAFTIHYYEHRFPVMPKSYIHILGHRLESLEQELGRDTLPFQELLSIMTELRHLPLYTETDPERVAERYREKEVVKLRLQRLCSDCAGVAAFIDENVRLINGQPGVAESFDLLDRILTEQVYRISHWRVATEEINYRRFFDINALGAIRVENEAVFAETHGFVLRLVGEGKVTGLRVDHVDGLYDPAAYLRRLQEQCLRARIDESQAGGQAEEQTTPPAKPPACPPFYIIGEKILMQGEQLPRDWPVHGATGYAFLNSVGGLFVDRANTRKFDAIYERFIRSHRKFPELAVEAKRLVMRVSMSSEINNLSYFLNTISERNRHTRDFTLNSLTKALVEVIAFFPVYRTYIRNEVIAERDRLNIEHAVANARRHNPSMGPFIFDYIHDVLLLRCPAGSDEEDLRLRLDFVLRFQQLTGPVMAKGVEDTASYVYNRLVSLNEVGGSPDRFGCLVDSFHQQNMERCKTYPHAMIATATHDTKRSEDVRARLNVLSEIPDLWSKALTTWSQFNRKRRKEVDGQQVPSRNEEYLLYQTLLGVWPHEPCPEEKFGEFRQRIRDYMRKAMREAKVNSSWVHPNASHEEAVDTFVDAILGDGDTPFVRSFLGLAGYVSRLGRFNSLSQALLKITSPGMPDFYQGTELWDLSLVDPDNRRPVDFVRRREMLLDLQTRERQLGLAVLCGELLGRMEDGGIKLFLTWKALTFRRENREIFEQGAYTPLPARGERAESAVAFARTFQGKMVIVVVPRFLSHLVRDDVPYPLGEAAWGDTVIELPDDSIQYQLVPDSVQYPLEGYGGAAGSYRNIFTGDIHAGEETAGRVLPLAAIFRRFPVALLEWRPDPQKK